MMYYLADKLTKCGIKTVATTTTKLYKPDSAHQLVLANTLTACRKAVAGGSLPGAFLILANNISVDDERKITGLNPEWINILAQEYADTAFLVEGDGSAGKSLKGHLAHEPVIPEDSRLVMPVMGIDVIGQPLNGQHVHRAPRAAQIAGVRENTIITAEIMARLLLSKDGYLHNCPAKAKIIPFINKADCQDRWVRARELCSAIMEVRDKRISGVLIGSLVNEQFSLVIENRIFY